MLGNSSSPAHIGHMVVSGSDRENEGLPSNDHWSSLLAARNMKVFSCELHQKMWCFRDHTERNDIQSLSAVVVDGSQINPANEH